MSKVKFQKYSDGVWVACNTANGNEATVYKINEYNALFDTPTRYRVDVNGVTVASMVDHFQTAKSIAIKKLRSDC